VAAGKALTEMEKRAVRLVTTVEFTGAARITGAERFVFIVSVAFELSNVVNPLPTRTL
jgi:hypothetical protein